MNRPVQGKELATPTGHFRIEVTAMATMAADERILTRAFEIIENVQDTELVVCKLRDLLQIDHAVYHSSKLGVSPTADPYIRLTYPATWIRRYLIMGYGDIDPVLREGFQRTLPFK
jgi:hypothetical protein